MSLLKKNSIVKWLKNEKILIFLIFLFAAFLRLYNLSSLPFNFHLDEVQSTFVGRYTLLHFRDPYGNFFPLNYFNLFGDYPPIIPMYLSGIATFIFGVNEFAARFPSAFFGALAVFPIYLFTKLLLKNSRIAIFSAFFISILPWHIVLSRASGESVIGITILLFGLYLLFKSVQRNKYLYALFACLLLLLTYYIYPSFRILIPLILLPLPIIFYKTKMRNVMIVILAICCISTLLIASTPWGKGRFNQTSLFTNPGIATNVKDANISLSVDESSILVARIFDNKIIGYAKVLLNQYLSYFSPNYLFLRGGYPLRYSVRDDGLIYIIFCIFIAGLLLPSSRRFRSKYLIYLLYLLLVAAIPAALTIDDVPNIRRSTFMLIPIVIFASIGLDNIFVSIKNYSKYFSIFVLIVFSLILTGEFIFFWHQYAQHNASNISYLRNDGDKEAILYLLKHKGEFKTIYAPPGLISYYLFFGNDFGVKRFSLGLNLKQLDNIKFFKYNDLCFGDKMPVGNNLARNLYVENGDCVIPDNLYTSKLILRHDSTRVYVFLHPRIK